MIKLFQALLSRFAHVDPRVYELEKELENYQYFVIGLVVVIAILFLVIYLQRRLITAQKGEKAFDFVKKISKKQDEPDEQKAESPAPAKPATRTGLVPPKDLPDPGLIFKYSLANEDVKDKMVVIGQTEGAIKTYSTEIINNHLSIYVRILENQRDKDIYNLPDRITEEYQIDLRREGKTLIYYQGLENYREMGARERIYVKKTPDEAGDPTFPEIPAKTPVRLRIGDRLDADGKFRKGYFEFHLFTQDYEVQTKAGVPKTEKYFLVRLYKTYPGYDTGAPTEEGLYPMIDPYTTKG
jgi:hypothetical protein